MHHTKSTPAMIVPHQQGFVESTIIRSLDCSYNPNISKINVRSMCVVWKEWTQNANYNPNIFFCKVSSLWVVLGQLPWGFIYELWYHNNQASLTLPTTKVPPPIPPTPYIPITGFMDKNCLREGSWGICPRMTFSCRYTFFVWWVPRYSALQLKWSLLRTELFSVYQAHF